MTLALRDYQQEAVNAIYTHLRTRDDNPCVVIPTGGGKTKIIAQVCLDAALEWSGRVLILAHVKELLEQSVKHLHDADERLISRVGVYSAGLGKREVGYPITVAGIQSVYKKATQLGRFDIILVDEAHLIPIDGEGMYRQFLTEAKLVNPNVRVAGFTATPYRMKDGLICAPENFLNHVCHETGVRELIARGFLCNLKSRVGSKEVDTSGLHIRAGEFIQSEIEDLMDTAALVDSACADIVKAVKANNRKSVLIFAASVEHGGRVAKQLRALSGCEVGEIYGDTDSPERASAIARFKSGALQYLVNMNVLTIGFDAPNVDMIALLRPTASPGLYYQVVGRGFRIAPGKDYCLVLDYGNNVMRHGPVDAIKPEKRAGQADGEMPAKTCPGYKCQCGKIINGRDRECSSCGYEIPLGVDLCSAILHTAYRVCPECGYEFPKPEKRHRATHGQEAILSGEITVFEFEVDDVFYSVHTKKGADEATPKTMRVQYKPPGINSEIVSEWICPEHEGYAYRKAAMWWRARSNVVMPKTARECVELALDGALAKPLKIKVEMQAGQKYSTVVGVELGPIPEYKPWLAEKADAEAEDEAERRAIMDELNAENIRNAGDSQVPF